MSDAYLVEGERRADELGNRGPLRFARDGNLEPDILEGHLEVTHACRLSVSQAG